MSRKTLRIIGWTLVIIASICLVFPLPFLMIAALIYPQIYNSKDHIEYEQKKLKVDAKVVSVTSKICGLKGEHKYRTVVVFDDGFKFIAHDTYREDSIFLYEIHLTADMKNQIVDRAISAHYKAIGIPRPPKARFIKCGMCGNNYEGISSDKCPICNSGIKIYEE